MDFLGTLDERDRRHFIASKAMWHDDRSIKTVCKAFGCSLSTVTKGIPELTNHIVPPDGRQHLSGGCAKRNTAKYPECVAAFANNVIVPHAIYDSARNMIYLTVGTGHDTSEFVCDNIEHWLFSQITRSRSVTTLYSAADACRRAAGTVTK